MLGGMHLLPAIVALLLLLPPSGGTEGGATPPEERGRHDDTSSELLDSQQIHHQKHHDGQRQQQQQHQRYTADQPEDPYQRPHHQQEDSQDRHQPHHQQQQQHHQHQQQHHQQQHHHQHQQQHQQQQQQQQGGEEAEASGKGKTHMVNEILDQVLGNLEEVLRKQQRQGETVHDEQTCSSGGCPSSEADKSHEHDKRIDEARAAAQRILRKLFGTHFTKPVVETVTGCQDREVGGRIKTTVNCPLKAGTTVTITGENFNTEGAKAFILPRAKKTTPEPLACATTVHDKTSPTRKLYCTLPKLNEGQVHDLVVVAMGSDKQPYESVLYDAIKAVSGGTNDLKKLNFTDFRQLGIGGLSDEFSQIFRRAFASRFKDPVTIKKLGIRHVRGLILHGPPGTGKTLLARKISNILGAKKVHVINGPEVLSKYVGQSEQNLRRLFQEARDEAAEDEGGLHLIVIDEMDAIMRHRGTGSESDSAKALYDGVTTQLLSLLDGMEDQGNLLVIGLTNRLDAIDKALLRPGRFEVKIKMPLPDEKGREEIFLIHTEKARTAGLLSPDIDIKKLARDTPSHTGADIEGIVKSAYSYAMATEGDFTITMEHFHRAMKEVQPSHGSSQTLNRYLERGVVFYNKAFKEMVLGLDKYAFQVKTAKYTRIMRVLLEGKPQSGLSTIAAYAAKRTGFPFMQQVSVEDLIGLSEVERARRIQGVFEDAYLVENGCVVLDHLEQLLEYSTLGRGSITMQQTLLQLLTQHPKGKGNLLVLATTNAVDVLRNMGLSHLWDVKVSVPLLEKNDMLAVMQSFKVFEDPKGAKSVASQMPLRMGIKQLVWLIDQARVRSGVSEDAHVPVEHKEGHASLPMWSGTMQYVVPFPKPPKSRATEAYVERDADSGWGGSVRGAAQPPQEQAEPAAQQQSSPYVSEKAFLAILSEAGLHSPETRSIPVATGTL